MDEQTRCPTCGRYLEINPDGFWDVEPGGVREHDPVVAYCDKVCADRKSPPARNPGGVADAFYFS
jgi:hypothetical protein